MHFRNLTPYLLIVRPGICVGTFVLVLLSTWVARDDGFPIVPAVLGAIGVALTAGAGSVINDFFDLRADEVNNPQRPLPSGAMTRRAALVYYFVLLAVSLPLLWLVNLWAFLVGAGTSLLLLFYSWKLREIEPMNGEISNAAVALSIGTMLAFGAIITRHFNGEIVLLFGFGIVVGFIREILGDIVDIEGDKLRGNLRTLPLTLGREQSLLIAFGILIYATVTLWNPLITVRVFGCNPLAVVPLLISALAASFYVRQVIPREENLRGAQMTLKIVLFVFPLSVALVSTFR